MQMIVAGYAVKENFYLSGAGIAERTSVQRTDCRNSMHVQDWNSINVILDILAVQAPEIPMIYSRICFARRPKKLQRAWQKVYGVAL